MQSLNIDNNDIQDLKQIKNLEHVNNLDLWYIKNKKELFENIDIVQEKCEEIVSKVIKPGMSLFEKELAIHDYLTQVTKYYENWKTDQGNYEVHTPVGLLTKGSAVCDGYAKTFNILMGMVGIESDVYYGKSLGDIELENHAWNIVNIDGKSYHVDVTWDDRDIALGKDKKNASLTHKYFNVSDDYIKKDHEIVPDRGYVCKDNFQRNQFEAFSLGPKSDREVYIGDDGLYIKDMDKGSQKLTTDKAYYVTGNGEYIFYANLSDGWRLYRIDKDGKNKVALTKEGVSTLKTHGDRIYYLKITSETCGLYSNNFSGSDEKMISGIDEYVNSVEYVNYYEIYNDSIYYSLYDRNSKTGRLNRVNLDGTNKISIKNLNTSGFDLDKDPWISFAQNLFFYNGTLYYNNPIFSNAVCKASLDGSSNEIINREKAKIFEIVGDFIYYYNESSVVRIKLDGTCREVLAEIK